MLDDENSFEEEEDSILPWFLVFLRKKWEAKLYEAELPAIDAVTLACV